MLVNQRILNKNGLNSEEYVITKIKSSLDTSSISEALDKIWLETRLKAEAANREIWDGTYYRLENIDEVISGSNHLFLSEVKYSTVKSLIEYSRSNKIPEKLHPQHINTGAILRSSDGKFIFGVKNGSSQSKFYDLIGGGLQSSELVVTKGQHLSDNVLKEIKEELNLSPNFLTNAKMLGIVQATNSCIIFIYFYQVFLTFDEIKNFFKNRSDFEMSDIIGISELELKFFLTSNKSYFSMLCELLNFKTI